MNSKEVYGFRHISTVKILNNYKPVERNKGMKTQETRDLEKAIIKATRKQGTFGVLECTIGWYGREIVDYITYNTKGEYRCYEIKSSVSDFHSKNQKSFYGHLNYYVLSQKVYDKVKDEIPNEIGVYVGENLVKRPKRQELVRPYYLKKDPRNMESILKDSMLRSLYREAEKMYDSEDDCLISRKNRYISNLKSQVKSLTRKYNDLTNLLFMKLGSRYLQKLESLKDANT